MSILIKNMTMPKNCTECRFAVDGWCYAYGRPNIEALATCGRTNFCPLIELPAHGRLIDADALIKCIEADAIWKDNAVNEYDDGIRAGATAMKRSILNAPTIVDAEDEEEK